MTRSFVVAVLTVTFLAAQARAAAFEELFNLVPAATMPQVQTAPVKGAVLSKPVAEESFLSFSILSTLPAPGQQTAAWLASRIPGLDTAALKEVPASAVEPILQRAAAAHASYLDVFTDPGLGAGNPEIYYLGQSVLNQLNANWVSGTLPISGRTNGGQPFQMQALVLGRGAVHILYSLSGFQFDDNGNTYEINGDRGRVTVTTLGRADVGISGVKAHGCMGPFCGWADIQRITKTGQTSSRVKTSRKTVDAPLTPVHRR